jgi:hypothetical protein
LDYHWNGNQPGSSFKKEIFDHPYFITFLTLLEFKEALKGWLSQTKPLGRYELGLLCEAYEKLYHLNEEYNVSELVNAPFSPQRHFIYYGEGPEQLIPLWEKLKEEAHRISQRRDIDQATVICSGALNSVNRQNGLSIKPRRI